MYYRIQVKLIKIKDTLHINVRSKYTHVQLYIDQGGCQCTIIGEIYFGSHFYFYNCREGGNIEGLEPNSSGLRLIQANIERENNEQVV